MIYDKADIVARKLLGQKVGKRVYYETAETSEEIRSFLVGTARVVITAPRRSGKTSELLRYAEDNHPNNQFCVVTANRSMQEFVIRKNKEMFYASNIAKRLLGGSFDGMDINPPLMILPTNIHLLRGQSRPVFCDEWNMLSFDIQETILDSGLFVAAVTS